MANNELPFEETMRRINDHEIEEIVFALPGLGKYAHCRIGWAYDVFPALGKKAPRGIVVELGKSLTFRSPKSLTPDYVEFRPPNGKLLLRDVWPKLQIASLSEAKKEDA